MIICVSNNACAKAGILSFLFQEISSIPSNLTWYPIIPSIFSTFHVYHHYFKFVSLVPPNVGFCLPRRFLFYVLVPCYREKTKVHLYLMVTQPCSTTSGCASPLRSMRKGQFEAAVVLRVSNRCFGRRKSGIGSWARRSTRAALRLELEMKGAPGGEARQRMGATVVP
uniref:Uncharacterized protein n=1 Tax=Arundo donax TaxID=35708 RepID=A0A0A8Y6I6_ARUDO